MYSVKRFEKGQAINSKVQLSIGTVQQIARSRSYGVVDATGKVRVSSNRLTGKPQLDLFDLKEAATKQAAFLNRKAYAEYVKDWDEMYPEPEIEPMSFEHWLMATA